MVSITDDYSSHFFFSLSTFCFHLLRFERNSDVAVGKPD